jgi:MFS family permease
MVNVDPVEPTIRISHGLTVRQGEEPAVAMSISDYDRLIERLDGCRPRGWADLWLFGAGAGAALLVGALVGALTVQPSGTREVFWVLAGAGFAVLALCLLGYFTQRRDHGREIAELEKDMDTHKRRANGDASPC